MRNSNERFRTEFGDEFSGNDFEIVNLLYGSPILFLLGLTPTRAYLLGINNQKAVVVEKRVGLLPVRRRSKIIWRGMPDDIDMQKGKLLWRVTIPGLQRKLSLNNTNRRECL